MSAVLENTVYQVKLGSQWEDMKLDIENLEGVAKELTSANGTMAGIFARRDNSNLGRIHKLILQYHGATRNYIKDVFDVICIDYKLSSFDDDVLKFAYSFTVRYGTDKERERAVKLREKHAAKERKTKSSWPQPDVVPLPRVVTGTVTIMPGN